MFGYGEPGGGWQPLVGDWNGDGQSGVGLYDSQGTTFYLTSALSSGVAEAMVHIDESEPGWTPLVGRWRKFEEPLAPAAVDQIELADVASAVLTPWDLGG